MPFQVHRFRDENSNFASITPGYLVRPTQMIQVEPIEVAQTTDIINAHRQSDPIGIDVFAPLPASKRRRFNGFAALAVAHLVIVSDEDRALANAVLFQSYLSIS
jgi:hypothetical protein